MSNHHKFTKSTSMTACDYDDEKGHMIIHFTSGGTYHYECHKDVYHNLKGAKSPGGYFHQFIRNNPKVKEVKK